MKEKAKIFLEEFMGRLKNGQLKLRAASLSYALLLAGIPLILVFLQLASLVLQNPQVLLDRLAEMLPQPIMELIKGVINSLATSASGTTISVSIFTAIWLGSNGVDSLIRSVNQSMNFEYRGNALLIRLISIIYTVFFMVAVILILLFYVFYDQIILAIRYLMEFLRLGEIMTPLLSITNSLLARLLPPILFILVLVLFYKTAPIVAKGSIRWSSALIGGLFSGMGIIIITMIYGFVLDNLSNLSLYFGSLAGILGLLVWLQYVCTIIVAGSEIIISRKRLFLNKDPKEPV